ncbi:MAG: LamG domain-containing protein, partial [candidate division KSB1 bacterium]|nr:LamG domain-containing protein [candidate division KSB1 bacterium]
MSAHASDERDHLPSHAASVSTGYAWKFDGLDDVGFIPDNPLLSGGPGKSLTLEAWVKLETTVGTHPIVTKLFDRATKDWGMEIQYGTVIADIETDNDNWFFVTDTLISAGVWTHVAFTFDNAADMVRIYVNGREAGSGKVQIKDMPDTDAAILMGYHPYDPSRMKGVLDEVRIWNYARHGNEIRQSMHQSLTGSETGLIGYWTFDEGQGQYAADVTGNGNRVQRGFTNAPGSDDPQWVISDAPVSTTPFVNLVSPNGGEHWFVDSRQQIVWAASSTITHLTLQFSSNAGLTWNTIANRVPNTGAYIWLVPNTVSNLCVIRIFDADSSAIADVSDSVFSILSPSLTVVF